MDDGDEARTGRHHRFLCVFRTPSYVKYRGCRLVEPKCKNLGEFFDPERANRHHETTEQLLRKSSFLLVDAQQCTAICFI
jgi:hypothetical protein